MKIYKLEVNGLSIMLNEASDSSNDTVLNSIANLSDWLYNLGFTDIQTGFLITHQTYTNVYLSLTEKQYEQFLSAKCNFDQFPYMCIQAYMNMSNGQDDPIKFDFEMIDKLKNINCLVGYK